MSTRYPSVFSSDSHTKSSHIRVARWDEHICQSQTELRQAVFSTGDSRIKCLGQKCPAPKLDTCSLPATLWGRHRLYG